MLILLDGSPAKIEAQEARCKWKFGQLLTPLTRNKCAGRPYAIDNGCFCRFNQTGWESILQGANLSINKPLFVSSPDVVGSARRTLELYTHFMPTVAEFARCLVLQDGIEDLDIPWSKVDAVFVGGTDAFKESNEAKQCCKAARILRKWVHVGRVNTAARVKAYAGLAQSIDGSGISRYNHMLDAVVSAVKELPEEQRVEIRGMYVSKTECGPWENDDVPAEDKDLFSLV